MRLTSDVHENLDAIDVAHQEGRIGEVIESLSHGKRLVGICLAKSMYLENSTYKGKEPYQVYANAKYGILKPTVKRYIDTWSAILKAPEELQKLLVKKDMKSLIPVGTNLANGEIDKDEIDWDRITNSASHGDVSSYLREMKGVEDNPNRINLWFDHESGDIHAYYKDQKHYIGFLDVHAMDNMVVEKSINRIRNKAGIK